MKQKVHKDRKIFSKDFSKLYNYNIFIRRQIGRTDFIIFIHTKRSTQKGGIYEKQNSKKTYGVPA